LDKRPDIIVVADDVYYHLPFDKERNPYYSFAAYKDNWQKTITVYSVGKLFSCTGWKIGWIVGPADLVRHISYVHESSCFVINVPS
jgi:kynurenine--oxoglutarate transaminase/cysteine-S-conjugate beta-lyase/glutamine--phenylpyruvate transaminase